MLSRLKDPPRNVLQAMQLARARTDGRFELRCSTAELVARQNRRAGMSRADLFVHYLAIMEAEGEDADGIRLLQKLLEVEQLERRSDMALLQVLQRDSLSRSLFVAGRAVVDVDLNLHSNPGALALAIHRADPEIAVAIKTSLKPGFLPPRYDFEWLAAKGFTDKDLSLVESAQNEVLNKLGISALPWEDLHSLRKEMMDFLPPGSVQHGRGGLYQTCEELLLPGQRPTLQRFHAYDLASLLKPSDRVLDIGCNCGFLSLMTSRYVAAVDGFDISPHFIDMANLAQKHLGRQNCKFATTNFTDFVASRPYDVIFSFAVHHWIGMPLQEYAERVKQLLKPGGLVLLESQDLNTHDRDWDDKLRQFCSAGFQEVQSGTMCDDSLISRRHVVVRDTRMAA